MVAPAVPRILCIAGSPRRGGNSDRLLEACMEGIGEAGGEVDLLVAARSGAAPCRGCNSCARTGVCVITDGMDEVNKHIDVADALVIASPVYFATVPAVLKVIYDRLQPYWARTYRLGQSRPPRRPGAFLLVGAGGDPYGFRCAADPTRSAFAVLAVDPIAELCVKGPDVPGDILSRHEDLARAFDIGAQVVRAARVSGAGD